jgi:hypothetical protein
MGLGCPGPARWIRLQSGVLFLIGKLFHLAHPGGRLPFMVPFSEARNETNLLRQESISPSSLTARDTTCMAEIALSCP